MWNFIPCLLIKHCKSPWALFQAYIKFQWSQKKTAIPCCFHLASTMKICLLWDLMVYGGIKAVICFLLALGHFRLLESILKISLTTSEHICECSVECFCQVLMQLQKEPSCKSIHKKVRETRWTGCHFKRDINKQTEIAKLSLHLRWAQVAEGTTHKPHRRYLLVCNNEYCQTYSWNISKKNHFDVDVI